MAAFTEDTFQRIRALIAQVCDLSPDVVKREGRLIGYQLDSVRALELIVAIEDDFRLSLDKDELYEVKTVAQLCEYVQARLPSGS